MAGSFGDPKGSNLEKKVGAHQGGHATTRFSEGFLEGSLKVGASKKGS